MSSYQYELKNVYLGYEFEPSSSTIAYWPLNSETLYTDQSGNWKNLTNVWTTIWTYQWVSCAYNNWDKNKYAWLNSPLTTSNNSFTASLWFYSLWDSANWQSLIQWWYWQTTQAFNMALNKNVMSVWWWSNDTSLNVTKINQWVHYIITYNWTTIKAYVNSELVLTVNLNYTIPTSAKTSLMCNYVRTDWATSDPLNWYLSNVIVENKVWTVEEVSKYYNQNKSLYWITN